MGGEVRMGRSASDVVVLQAEGGSNPDARGSFGRRVEPGKAIGPPGEPCRPRLQSGRSIDVQILIGLPGLFPTHQAAPNKGQAAGQAVRSGLRTRVHRSSEEDPSLPRCQSPAQNRRCWRFESQDGRIRFGDETVDEMLIARHGRIRDRVAENNTGA